MTKENINDMVDGYHKAMQNPLHHRGASRLLTLLLLIAVASPVNAWWNPKWTARKQLTIDASITGADIGETLTDVPLLVRLHTGNFGFFLDLAENGKDIRFVGGDKTPLKYHLEKIDLINEMAFIWVKVPQINGGSNSESLWLYYANPEAVSGEDSGGTYGVNQIGIYHFGSDLGADATAYGNNAAEATAIAEPAGLIGSAARFRGTDRVVLGSLQSSNTDSSSGWSISAWVKIEQSEQASVIFQAKDANASVELVMENGAYLLRATTESGTQESPPQAIQANTFQHLTVDFNGSQLVLFIDGAEMARLDVALPPISVPVILGAGDDGRYFTGVIDEVRISNISRSADWIKLSARSQGVGSTVLSFGGDESNQSSGSASYFAIILANVSTDGWVIIGLLALMLVTSLIVMVSKGVVISRVKRSNRSFIRQFRQLGSGDPSALDLGDEDPDQELEDSAILLALFGDHKKYRSSSLYHIYHSGIQEIKQRKGNAIAGLSPEALAVVRVHLDAALSREFQRLNKQMVLLTIAISGGPFLGLLGTVMGVMITFAAIAATGDVNISAIAPGVSAALMTTVAGLAVAIPSLFGYNYLATQIKEMTAEMRIFVDEFIHQIAEKSKL